VLFVFVPGGDHSTAVVKTYAALGLREAGIRLIGSGDMTDDTKLQTMGNAAVGLVTMHHYNVDLDNAENKTFVAEWKKAYGADSTPDFFAVGGYDGMAAIVHAVSALKGWRFDSPRGPIMIDPETRDIIMNEYLVEVVKGSDGKLHQKVLGKLDNVKDACKAQKIAPCG